MQELLIKFGYMYNVKSLLLNYDRKSIKSQGECVYKLSDINANVIDGTMLLYIYNVTKVLNILITLYIYAHTFMYVIYVYVSIVVMKGPFPTSLTPPVLIVTNTHRLPAPKASQIETF